MPINARMSPSAPALCIPYIGLCGLLSVSLSERAQMIVPLVLSRVVWEVFEMMPLRNALSAWNAMPSSRLT